MRSAIFSNCQYFLQCPLLKHLNKIHAWKLEVGITFGSEFPPSLIRFAGGSETSVSMTYSGGTLCANVEWGGGGCNGLQCVYPKALQTAMTSSTHLEYSSQAQGVDMRSSTSWIAQRHELASVQESLRNPLSLRLHIALLGVRPECTKIARSSVVVAATFTAPLNIMWFEDPNIHDFLAIATC